MLKTLTIRNWKRFDELHLTFDKGIHFLVGPNGSGKTSILDAVGFALLGDLSATSIYQNITYKDLIRDPSEDLEISLSFSPMSEGEYNISRKHISSSNRKSCELTLNGSVISGRWDEATDEILNLYKTTNLFLRSVIMLSEGDTFSYSTKPPGEGLTRHIENVLGINRMEKLRSDLGQLRRDFESRGQDLRERINEYKLSTDEDKRNAQILSLELDDLRAERDEILSAINGLNEGLGAVEPETQRIESLIRQVRDVFSQWEKEFGDLPNNYEFAGAIESLQKSLPKEKDHLLEQRDLIRDEIAWLAAQQESQNQILEIVKPLDKEEEVVCPVCKRPLTKEMIDEIKEQITRYVSELDERKREKQINLPTLEENLAEIDRKLQLLMELNPKVESVLREEPKSFSIPTLETLLTEISSRRDSINSEIETLKTQIEDKNKQISVKDQEFGLISKETDEKNLLKMSKSLVSSTKGQLISEIFQDSINSTLADERKYLLEPLTEELSETWTSFLKNPVAVELDDDAQIMVLDEESGSRFEFPQLSGGEKTALLIFTQVFLSKYFSDVDFLLLDEPLEHLDSRNRWALLRFLVDTAKMGYPKQLLVTTVEEALIREYLKDDVVNISVLSLEYPTTEGV